VSKKQPKKKDAVIYDITGTLTKKSVAHDARKDAAKGKKVLVMTSRPAEQRQDAQEFLKKHRIPADELMMRANKDKRKDSKVKKDLYEKKVKNKYKVKKAYDDKPSNVKMFRSEGIKTKKVK
jgi:phosphoserine phosphatase